MNRRDVIGTILGSVLPGFLPSFSSQICDVMSHLSLYSVTKKCHASHLSHFWEECDALAHENIFFKLWRFLSHPSRKTSHFCPAGTKLFWTWRNVTIRLGRTLISSRLRFVIGGIWADLVGNKFPSKLLTLQSPGGLLRGGGRAMNTDWMVPFHANTEFITYHSNSRRHALNSKWC